MSAAAHPGVSLTARPRAIQLALAGTLVLAAANFSWQLSSISYFADEALSINNAMGSIGQVVSQVNRTEANPWTYFLLLHEYLGHTAAGSEWSIRLPSVIAGVALVASVFWLARLFVPSSFAVLAALLCAFSPLVLQYAQQARAYVFVMLAITVAFAAALEAERHRRTRGRWLTLACFAAVIALWLHYAAALALAPLCVWVARNPIFPRRQRVPFLAACVIAEALMVPLLLEQSGNTGGLNGLAGVTVTNVLSVIGTPFAGRFNAHVAIPILATLVVVVACVRLLTYKGELVMRPRTLAAFAVFPVAAIVAIGLGGRDVISTRYTAVAAPLMIVAITAGLATLRAAAALALAAPIVFLAAWGTAVSHSHAGFYPASKPIMAYIARHRRSGDLVAFGLRLGLQWPFEYYGARDMRPPPGFIDPNRPDLLRAAVRARRRIWLVTQAPPRHYGTGTLVRTGSVALRPYGYRVVDARAWTTVFSYVASLAVPVTTSRR